jgi:hypothetical protein
MAPVAFVLAVGFLFWQAWREPSIPFLSGGPGKWIAYPSPVSAHTFDVLNLPAVFRHEFTLARPAPEAMLDWRCFQNGRLQINGQDVAIPKTANWKTAARINVASQLRPGTNSLVATVWADSGPSSLSLRLETGEFTILTDTNWDSSLAGAIQRPATLAGVAVEPQPGNPLFGGERTGEALRRTIWMQCVFLLVSLSACFLWRRSTARVDTRDESGPKDSPQNPAPPKPAHPPRRKDTVPDKKEIRAPDSEKNQRWLRNTAIIALAVAWLALLTHNFLCLTLSFGFDFAAHLDYIKYIQTQRALPLANQGLEMFQPPLYYLLSAFVLGLSHSDVMGLDGLRALRFLNLIAGGANVFLVWIGVGLLYPGQWKKQLGAATLAAFVPWQLYLLHYPTNEILCGTLATAALCACLKCIGFGDASNRTGWLVAIGAAIGAACLAKASGLMLLPLILAILWARLIVQKQRSPAAWLKTSGWVVGVAVAVGGWHYWRTWRHFGTPFLGGWSRESIPNPWWQQPGLATFGHFGEFGRALVAPYFAGFHGFWDAIYSTLWGDGLCGGAARIWLGPPWNHDFMTAGYILALVPSFLIVTGITVLLVRFIQKPRLDLLLIGGVAAASFLALAQLNLKLPYLACGKAFFALIAMLPFCVFALAGFEFWEKLLGFWAGTCLLALLGVWLLNDCASFWIRPNGPENRLLQARQKFILGKEDSAPDFASLVQLDPHNSVAAEFLARAELQAHRPDRFEAVVKQATVNNSVNAQLALLEVRETARRGKLAEALKMAADASQNSPDDPAIAETWLTLARAAKQDRDIVAAGEWLLRIDPANLPAHKTMAEALTRLGKPEQAALHGAIGHATAF